MADYKLTDPVEPCVVIRASDHAFIPPDPANADYQEYLNWVALGNVPDPADPVPEPGPAPADANTRLDAGIDAAIDAAEAVRNAIHGVPNNFNAANFQAFLIQAKALSDAFVAMLEAQRGPPEP